MIINFFKFIFELIMTAGQSWQYDVPTFTWSNEAQTNGLSPYRVIYFSATGELEQSDIIEAQSAESAEAAFLENHKHEVFDVYKVTK